MPINAADQHGSPLPGAAMGQFPPPGYFFTKAECLRRMKSVIDFCQVDRRRLKICFWHPPIGSWPVLDFFYDHQDPESYVSAPSIDDCFISWVAENQNVIKDDKAYRSRKLSEYLSDLDYLRQFFSVIGIRSEKKNGTRFVSAVACLGSIHHSPRIFGRLSESRPVAIYRPEAYADLC